MQRPRTEEEKMMPQYMLDARDANGSGGALPYRIYVDCERAPGEACEGRWYSTKGMGTDYIRSDVVHEAIQRARLQEREQCAKTAEAYAHLGDMGQSWLEASRNIADAIRTSGKG